MNCEKKMVLTPNPFTLGAITDFTLDTLLTGGLMEYGIISESGGVRLRRPTFGDDIILEEADIELSTSESGIVSLSILILSCF